MNLADMVILNINKEWATKNAKFNAQIPFRQSGANESYSRRTHRLD